MCLAANVRSKLCELTGFFCCFFFPDGFVVESPKRKKTSYVPESPILVARKFFFFLVCFRGCKRERSLRIDDRKASHPSSSSGGSFVNRLGCVCVGRGGRNLRNSSLVWLEFSGGGGGGRSLGHGGVFGGLC